MACQPWILAEEYSPGMTSPSNLVIISAYADALPVPPVRHDLVVYSHPTQALFGTPQPGPNRGLDMVVRYEVVALTFI